MVYDQVLFFVRVAMPTTLGGEEEARNFACISVSRGGHRPPYMMSAWRAGHDVALGEIDTLIDKGREVHLLEEEELLCIPHVPMAHAACHVSGVK